MSTRLAVALMAVLLCGCSSVEMVKMDEGDQSLHKVNRAVRGQVVRLDLHSGEKKNVMSLHVAPDSVTWIDRKTNTIKGEPLANVREISVRKAGRGALRGLLVGVVVGAAVGGARALAQGDDPVEDPLAITKEEKLRMFPIAHAVYASLLSTPIGAMLGTRQRFQFETKVYPPARVTQR